MKFGTIPKAGLLTGVALFQIHSVQARDIYFHKKHYGIVNRFNSDFTAMTYEFHFANTGRKYVLTHPAIACELSISKMMKSLKEPFEIPGATEQESELVRETLSEHTISTTRAMIPSTKRFLELFKSYLKTQDLPPDCICDETFEFLKTSPELDQ